MKRQPFTVVGTEARKHTPVVVTISEPPGAGLYEAAEGALKGICCAAFGHRTLGGSAVFQGHLRDLSRKDEATKSQRHLTVVALRDDGQETYLMHAYTRSVANPIANAEARLRERGVQARVVAVFAGMLVPYESRGLILL